MSKRGHELYVGRADTSKLDAYPSIFSGRILPLLYVGERLSMTRTDTSIKNRVEARYTAALLSLHGFVMSTSAEAAAKNAETNRKGHRSKHVSSMANQVLKYSKVGQIDHIGIEVVDPDELPCGIVARAARYHGDKSSQNVGTGLQDIYLLMAFSLKISGKQPRIGAFVSIAFASGIEEIGIGYSGILCTNPEMKNLTETGLVDVNRVIPGA